MKTRYDYWTCFRGIRVFLKGLGNVLLCEWSMCVTIQFFSNIYEPVSKQNDHLKTRPKQFGKIRNDFWTCLRGVRGVLKGVLKGSYVQVILCVILANIFGIFTSPFQNSMNLSQPVQDDLWRHDMSFECVCEGFVWCWKGLGNVRLCEWIFVCY